MPDDLTPLVTPPADLATQLLRAHARALESLAFGAPLADVLRDLVGATEALNADTAIAAILILDDDGRLWTGAAPGLPDDYNAAIDGLVAEVELGTCSHAAVTGEIVITPDIDACPRWAPLKALPLGLGLVAAWSQPIVARDGRVLGTFGTYFRDRREPTALERQLVATLAHTAAIAIEQDRARNEREQQQRLLDRALEAADMGPWRYEMATQICHFSPRAQRLYGLDGPTFLHDEAGVHRLLNPDDVPAMWAAVATATDPQGDGRYNVEYRVPVPGGGWRWLRVWGLAEFETKGGERRAVRLVGASRDVTDAHEQAMRQRLLLDELNHRVKNNLAVVQSIAAQTLRYQPEPGAFAEAFTGRIAALASVHGLLTRSEWRGAVLMELIETALEPFARGDCVSVVGPAIEVDAATSLALSLILHEMATNAAKYGALSRPAGTVAVTWDFAEAGRAKLRWKEAGGPPVRPPTRKGFGSRLLKMSVDQLGGASEVIYPETGVEACLSFPVLQGSSGTKD